MTKRRSARPDAHRLINQWKDTPEGTPVIVTKDDGSEIATKTRSEPYEMHGRAVIWLEGISGCYALERVRLAP